MSEQGNDLDRAINTVARAAIASAGEDVDWGDFPEIGEGDWYDVLAEIGRLTPNPDRTEFLAAYTLLEARAEQT